MPAICRPTAARWASTRRESGPRKGTRAPGPRASELQKLPVVAPPKSSASLVGNVRRFVSVLVLTTALSACHTEDPARAALRTRLRQETRLTPDEIRAFFDQIAPSIVDRKVTVKQGALIRTLDDEQRTSVLGMLSDPGAVYDGGIRVEGKSVWRGLKTGGTA